MPKVICNCGHTLDFGGIPSPIVWRTLSDVEFDKFSGAVDAEEIFGATKMMILCPQCGRLWAWWDDDSGIPTEYIPVGRP